MLPQLFSLPLNRRISLELIVYHTDVESNTTQNTVSINIKRRNKSNACSLMTISSV